MVQSVAKNTAYLTAASIAQRIISFGYFILLARVMRPENTGAYFLALSMVMIFQIVSNFGVTSVVVREVAKDHRRALDLARTALGLMAPFMAVAIISANVASWLLGQAPAVRELVLLGSVLLVADALSALYYGILRGLQNLRYESIGIIAGQLLVLAFGSGVLWSHPSLPLLVLAVVLGSVFNAVFSFWQVRRSFGWSLLLPSWDRSRLVRLLRDSFAFGLSGVFVKVASYLDSIFISIFIGTAAVGVYSLAYKLAYAFQFLPLAFVAALFPNLSALSVSDPRSTNRVLMRSLWYMMFLATPIIFGVWALAPDIVRLAGSDYAGAVPVLRVLILVLFAIFLDYPIGSLLNATNRQNTKTAIMGVTMVINAVGNWLLIPALGIAGAAYAGLLCFFFMFAAGLYFVPRVVPDFRFRAMIAALLPIFGSGLAMAAAVLYARPALGFILSVPLGAVVYFAALFATRTLRWSDLRQFRDLWRRPQPYVENIAHDA